MKVREIPIDTQTDHTLPLARRPETSQGWGGKDRHQISPRWALLMAKTGRKPRSIGMKRLETSDVGGGEGWRTVLSLVDETRTKEEGGGGESVDRIAHRHFAGETRVRKARDVCVKTLGRQGVGNGMLE